MEELVQTINDETEEGVTGMSEEFRKEISKIMEVIGGRIGEVSLDIYQNLENESVLVFHERQREDAAVLNLKEEKVTTVDDVTELDFEYDVLRGRRPGVQGD